MENSSANAVKQVNNHQRIVVTVEIVPYNDTLVRII